MLLLGSRTSSTAEDRLSCFLTSSFCCVWMSASDLFILPGFECTSRVNASAPDPPALALASNRFYASSRLSLAPLTVHQSNRNPKIREFPMRCSCWAFQRSNRG